MPIDSDPERAVARRPLALARPAPASETIAATRETLRPSKAEPACEDHFGGVFTREQLDNLRQMGSLAPTSHETSVQLTGPFQEHPDVAPTLLALAKRAQQGGASSMRFLPERRVLFDAYAFAYPTGLAKQLNIPNAPAGPLRGTVVVHVSGHASGGIIDKVTGWADHQLTNQGLIVGDDSRAFQMLRAAASQAVHRLASDQRKTTATVDLSALRGAAGASLALPRGLFHAMQDATVASADSGVAQLAHWGNEALRKHFGSSNTYDILIRTPDGRTTHLRNLARNDPARIELATRFPIELPPGTVGEVLLEAWPTGSTQVAGYVEARRYHIHIGKNLFNMAKAIQGAREYQARHPEIRWDTKDERYDLEEHRVAPSPHPYLDA